MFKTLKNWGATALGVLGFVSAASAEVPAIVGTTVTQMQTDGTSIFTTVFPFAAAMLGLGIVLKLFKRFVKQA